MVRQRRVEVAQGGDRSVGGLSLVLGVGRVACAMVSVRVGGGPGMVRRWVVAAGAVVELRRRTTVVRGLEELRVREN